MRELSAVSILLVTVSIAIGRPRVRSLRLHHSHAAILGALLCLLTGLVPPALAVHALNVLLYPVITIVSLMIITLIAEDAGLFHLLIRILVRASRGDGRKLFQLLFFTGTLVGAVFTNDAAVLIFTPLVVRMVGEIQDDTWTERNRSAYYFGTLYVANLVGGLVISNPINIIVASLFKIGFLEYASWMIVPALVSILTSYFGLRYFFRRDIPVHFNGDVRYLVRDRRRQVVCGLVLAATLVGFFVEPLTSVATWQVALAGAVTLLAMDFLTGSTGARHILRGVGWDVIVFVLGIFIVGYGLRAAGLTHAIGAVLLSIGRLGVMPLSFAVGLVSAVTSSIMNNHPTANIMAMVIQDLALPASPSKMLALAALIGGDLGPKMLPIGSLAALLWFRLLRDRGVQVSYSLYVKMGVPITLAAVLLSIAVLEFEVLLFGY